ncbi:MAG: family acetyltransferase [Solirubrobacterales bacterium]|nr:family acetyltransferase [Solirubrobacterales bacterium]
MRGSGRPTRAAIGGSVAMAPPAINRRLTPCELRQGCTADIDGVLELWVRAEAAPTVTDNIDALRMLLDVDPGALLVAEVDGRIVGAVIAAWNGWRGSFYRLAVDPEHRGRGLATHLVRAGEQRLRELGAVRIDALAATHDPVATGFWQACGYRRQSDRARFVLNF